MNKRICLALTVLAMLSAAFICAEATAPYDYTTIIPGFDKDITGTVFGPNADTGFVDPNTCLHEHPVWKMEVEEV